jgi:hypothetical protein
VKRAAMAISALRVDAPDRRTSLADLRIALCLELGVDIADIDPASGYGYSRTAYEHVRSLWRRAFAEAPDSAWVERNYREVRADWLARRPDWGDDWLAPDTATLPDLLMIPLFELEATHAE